MEWSEAAHPVVYTAIFGGKDDLIEDHRGTTGWRLVCFTDDPAMVSDRVEVIRVPQISADPTRSARYYKALPWLHVGEAPFALWIDGNVRIDCEDLTSVVERWLGERSIGALRHQQRDCIYRESRAVIELGKDDRNTVKRQVKSYRQEGFPDHFGLHFTKVVCWRPGDAGARVFSEAWWNEIRLHSRRCQLSFDYARWRTGVAVATRAVVSDGEPRFFESVGHAIGDEPGHAPFTRRLAVTTRPLRQRLSRVGLPLTRRQGC